MESVAVCAYIAEVNVWMTLCPSHIQFHENKMFFE